MPIDFFRQKLEDTLAKAGFKQDVAAELSQSFIEGPNVEEVSQ